MAEEVPEIFYSDTFYHTSATLYVPASAIEKYKSADVWKDFESILPIAPGMTGVTDLKANGTDSNHPVYNLHGQRILQKPAKGYYIRGGKKVVIR